MISFRHGQEVFAIPWHQVRSVRIVKRFPKQGERLGEFNTKPIYLLLVNDLVFGRYESIDDAESELSRIEFAYSRNEPYRIAYALTDDEYKRFMADPETS